jgi:leucyl aminopeptidase
MSIKVSFASKPMTKKDLLIVILDESLELGKTIASLDKEYNGIISNAINSKTLITKKGCSLSLFANKGKTIQEILIYFVGGIKNYDIEKADRIGGSIFSSIAKTISSLTVYYTPSKNKKIINEELAARIIHGMILRSYTFHKYKLKSKNKHHHSLKEIEIITKEPSLAKKYYSPLKSLEEGIYLTRDLVSEPANVLTPIALSEEALKLKALGIKVEVLNLSQIKRLKMGALLGCGYGKF